MDIEESADTSLRVEGNKPESFRKLETTMAALFAVPKEELEKRIQEEKRKGRKRIPAGRETR